MRPVGRRRKVAIAGFGTIGRAVAKGIQAQLPDLELVALAGRDQAKAKAAAAQLAEPVPVMSVRELPNVAEVIVECVPAPAFREVAEPAIERGRTLVTVSGAALLDNMDVVEAARATGARIILATGALLGLDAVRAAAFGAIETARIVTRKPPKSLQHAKDVVERGLDLGALEEPLQLFEGTAREGARRYPANVNVAAALALAGSGPDHTRLEIWADPGVTRNTQRIFVESDCARMEMSIENVPSEENPGTGKITALSVLAALDTLTTPLRVGT